MTKPDPIRLLNELHTEVAFFLTMPHTFANLGTAMRDAQPGQPKAQDLNGGPRGSGVSRPTEDAALSTPRRGEPNPTMDLRLYEQDIAYLNSMITRWKNWHGYVTTPPKTRRSQAGQGTCPPSNCQTCWSYGTAELVDDRYAKAKECRWCLTERAKIGRRVPESIWNLHKQGKRVTVADYRRLEPEVARMLVPAPAQEVPA